MNYKEAKNKSRVLKLVGIALFIPSTISTVISFLKLLYFRIEDGTVLGKALAKPFKQFVSWVYEQTTFLSMFWESSPTPDFRKISEEHNFYFLGIYALIIISSIIYASGKSISLRLAKINQKIENQMIEDSIRGKVSRTKKEIIRETEVPSGDFFNNVHKLYIAPIITGLIVALLAWILIGN